MSKSNQFAYLKTPDPTHFKQAAHYKCECNEIAFNSHYQNLNANKTSDLIQNKNKQYN